MKKPKIYKGKNFYLVEERKEQKSNRPSIIKSSGYTIDEKGIYENWIITQFRTLFHSDRSSLPDPMIFESSKEVNGIYAGRSVYTLYLTPSCRGIKYAQEELSDYIERSYDSYSFVGHSKGGLILSGLDIFSPSKFVFVTPTFGCIMGNEAQIFRKIEDYKRVHNTNFIQNAELSFYKGFVHLIGSRRPVDLDMSPNSDFLKHINLDDLKNHKVLLITANCPSGKCSVQDAFFRHTGSFLGLAKEGDGMVSLENQSVIEKYAEKVIRVSATHPTVLNHPDTLSAIYRFLNE